MARFRGQTLYMRAATRDVAFGTNVRALLGTSGADTNFTVTFTSTTAATQTVQPFTNTSQNVTDNRTTHGWAMSQNDASEDGVGSGLTVAGIGIRKRVIPAGVWQFQFGWTSNAPALRASYPVTISFHVYRVAANGGARTLLFSVDAAATTVSLVEGSGTGAASSPAQPEYLLETNESIHVAAQVTSNASSSILGWKTNTVITFTTGTAGTAFVTLPAPGMRDVYYDTNASVGGGLATESILTRKDTMLGAGKGAGQMAKLASYFRALDGLGSGLADRQLLTVLKFLQIVGTGSGTRATLVRKDVEAGIGKGAGSRALLARKEELASGNGAGAYDYLAQFYRAFTGAGNGSALRSLLVRKDELSAGRGAVRPRIALDWDDLPDAGGGGQVINVVRPLFIFED